MTEETASDLPERYVDEKKLGRQWGRDFILFGTGAFAALAGLWWIAPLGSKKKIFGERTADALDTLAARLGATRERSQRFQNRALTFDDDIAEALYSPNRTVRTYSKRHLPPLPNNH